MKHISFFLLTFFYCCYGYTQTVQYQYDALQRLTQATYSNGITIQYSYDALGNRTQHTINNNSAAPCNAMPTLGLVAYYPFNGNANDMSGNGNHGTGLNGVSLAPDRNNTPNSAYYFDGSDDYITVPASATLNTILQSGNATFCGWVKTVNNWNGNMGAHIFCKPNGYNLHYRLLVGGSGASFQIETQFINPSFNLYGNTNWNFFVGVKNGNVGLFYLNGQLIYSGAFVTDQWATDLSAPLEIGRDAHGPIEYTNGYIDDIAIYNRALSPSEVQQLYTSTAFPVAAFTTTNNGLSQTFTNTSQNGTTYSWNFGNGTTSTAANPTVTYTSAGTYNVCLTTTNSCGSNTYCQQVVINPCVPIYPAVTANQTTVCVGGTSTFTNTLAGIPTPFTRQWQFSTDNITFSNITNATSSTYTATLNTAGTYYYRLAVIKSGQCTGYSNVQSVTVVPDPSVTITGAAAFCGSGSTTFTANPQYGTGNCSLQWQQYTNNAWANIANGVNPTFTTSTLTASRNYRVRLSCTGSGCGLAYSNISALTINPLPNVTTNAPTAVLCEGGQRGITASGANTYTWTPAAGLSATTGAVVTAAPLVSTTYVVTGTNTTTGCVKSANAVFTVVTDPTVTINGPASMCLGASTTLTSVISGGTGTFTYLWQSSINGTAWTSITGATAATYSLISTTAGTRYYRLKLSCTGTGCTAVTYSNVLQISTNAMPTIALAGTSPICVGGTSSMTATTTGGIGTATYIWQRSTDGGQTWTTLSGANSPNYSPTNIQVNTSYKVTVSYTGVGCGSVTSNVFNILVNPDPSIIITGTTALCGAGSTTFSATTTGGAGTCGVQWQEYVSGAWTNISGGTGNNFTTPTLTTTRQYRAFVACSESGCGTAYSSTGVLTINALPNVTTNAPTTVGCEGVSRTITASGANNYMWSPSAGLNTTSGASVIATPTLSTTYTVTGTNTTTGCSNTASASITVLPDPSVSINGPTSVTSGATATLTSTATGGTGTCTYQWQTSTNGTTWSNISGATGSTYTTPALTSARYYRLTLSCNGTACNIATSNVLFISIIVIKQNDLKGDSALVPIAEALLLSEENVEAINVFPNPTQGLLNVELSHLKQGANISLRLFDAMGKLVETYKTVSVSNFYTTQLHLSKLAMGLYSLEISIDDKISTYKVAKE